MCALSPGGTGRRRCQTVSSPRRMATIAQAARGHKVICPQRYNFLPPTPKCFDVFRLSMRKKRASAEEREAEPAHPATRVSPPRRDKSSMPCVSTPCDARRSRSPETAAASCLTTARNPPMAAAGCRKRAARPGATLTAAGGVRMAWGGKECLQTKGARSDCC